jgi:hypothetical protein
LAQLALRGPQSSEERYLRLLFEKGWSAAAEQFCLQVCELAMYLQPNLNPVYIA